jgi:hypothetical protein
VIVKYNLKYLYIPIITSLLFTKTFCTKYYVGIMTIIIDYYILKPCPDGATFAARHVCDYIKTFSAAFFDAARHNFR